MVTYITSNNTTYTYDNSGRLIKETTVTSYNNLSSTTTENTYLYSDAGVVGMIYTANGSSQTYYFDRNIKGDVIGIYNSSGARIVKYSYDSWGNCSIYSSNDLAIAKANPFRYRGYYYDEESKLYFLNARYYNPAWRRFISPDDTAYLDPDTPNGLNLYAYCNNDPVNYSDPSGNSALAFMLIAMTVAGGIIGGAVSYNQQKETTGEVKFSKMIMPIIGGAALGLMLGGLVSLTGSMIAGNYGTLILSKNIAKVLFLGVKVKEVAKIGALAFNIGALIATSIFQIEFELLEFGSYDINLNQPIIKNQPQYYK